jgi:peptidyl-prolyl cis-trans isomerase A (cyclophilin A)
MPGRPSRWTAAAGVLFAGAWVAAANPALMKPDSLNAKAPDTFRADFETSKGRFVIEVTRAWAPRGADRFYNLVKSGYYDNVRFFRVVPGFVVQFGIHGDPAVSTAWKAKKIQDDPVQASNTTGHVTFAMGGPNTRTTQIFINLQDNSALDAQGFAPIGRIVAGMEVVGSLHSEYGESLTELQPQIFREGNLFLAQRAPKLDFIKKASIATATPPKP